MDVLQAVVLVLTAVAAGCATFFYNDGRDGAAKASLQAWAAVGVVGIGLWGLSELLYTPESAVPRCDWSTLDQDLDVQCETSDEASRRAAQAGWLHIRSSYLMGPVWEGGATVSAGLLGLGLAMLTGRRPADGREPRILLDDD